MCDFGVENCWDFKRDRGTLEDLESLDMARMLWDATPSEVVKCAHGRRRPVKKETSKLGLGTRPKEVKASVPSWQWVVIVVVLQLLVAALSTLYKRRVSVRELTQLSFLLVIRKAL